MTLTPRYPVVALTQMPTARKTMPLARPVNARRRPSKIHGYMNALTTFSMLIGIWTTLHGASV